MIATGRADAAQDYAQRIPVRVISWMLGVPDELDDTFTGWVRDVLEYGHDPERSVPGWNAIAGYFIQAVEDRAPEPGRRSGQRAAAGRGRRRTGARRARPRHAGPDPGGRHRHDVVGHRLGDVAPGHPRGRPASPRRRTRADPDRRRGAAAGLLAGDDGPRSPPPTPSSPAARSSAGDQVLLSFPAANRDPEAFERADEVVIDRASSTATSRSASASTAAPGPTWPAWRCASPSRSG